MKTDPLNTLALMGAARISSPPPPPHPVLSECWEKLDWKTQPAKALLQAAALVGMARVAGARPISIAAKPEAAPEEKLPVCPASARGHLRQMLGGLFPHTCLSEWLELCIATKRIVPPEFLPALLTLGEKHKDLRPLLGQAVGERGFWLARQNPEWTYLVSPERLPEGVWDTGTPAERLAFFAALRQQAPQQAREKLEAAWVQETPDFRSMCLEKMAMGLGPGDIPLLEKALVDRRKEVRLPARILLARLPDSPLAQRMRQRAEAIVKLVKHLLSRRLEVVFPAAFDPEWKKDALEEKPPGGKGEKAYWCGQIVALVPIGWYAQHFALKLDKMVELAAASDDWRALLLESWVNSVVNIPDPAAAAVLAGVLLELKTRRGLDWSGLAVTMFAQCDAGDQWPLLEKLAEQEPAKAHEDSLFWQCFEHFKGPLDQKRAGRILRPLELVLAKGSYVYHSDWAAKTAQRFPVELRDTLAKALAITTPLPKPAETFLQILEFRASLRRALTQT